MASPHGQTATLYMPDLARYCLTATSAAACTSYVVRMLRRDTAIEITLPRWRNKNKVDPDEARRAIYAVIREIFVNDDEYGGGGDDDGDDDHDDVHLLAMQAYTGDVYVARSRSVTLVVHITSDAASTEAVDRAIDGGMVQYARLMCVPEFVGSLIGVVRCHGDDDARRMAIYDTGYISRASQPLGAIPFSSAHAHLYVQRALDVLASLYETYGVIFRHLSPRDWIMHETVCVFVPSFDVRIVEDARDERTFEESWKQFIDRCASHFVNPRVRCLMPRRQSRHARRVHGGERTQLVSTR